MKLTMLDLSFQRGLTAADIEIVSSPMEAINKQNKEMSYSSQTAYEAANVDQEDAVKQRESWPEPPSQTSVNRTEGKARPPDRVPPRVLPKPPMQQSVSDKTFL